MSEHFSNNTKVEKKLLEQFDGHIIEIKEDSFVMDFLSDEGYNVLEIARKDYPNIVDDQLFEGNRVLLYIYEEHDMMAYAMTPMYWKRDAIIKAQIYAEKLTKIWKDTERD